MRFMLYSERILIVDEVPEKYMPRFEARVHHRGDVCMMVSPRSMLIRAQRTSDVQSYYYTRQFERIGECRCCGKVPASQRTCARCRVAVYCDAHCQRLSWHQHRARECANLSESE